MQSKYLTYELSKAMWNITAAMRYVVFTAFGIKISLLGCNSVWYIFTRTCCFHNHRR